MSEFAPRAHIDVLFDSTTADNKDKPMFTLSPPVENVVGITLVWANVPFSYYTIDNLNNEITVQIWVTDAYVDHVRRLRPGTYNPDTLADEFMRLFQMDAEIQYAGGFQAFFDVARAKLIIYNADMIPLEGDEAGFRIYTESPQLGSILGWSLNDDDQYMLTSQFQQVWRNSAIVAAEYDETTYPDEEDRIHYAEPDGLLNLAYSPVLRLHSNLAGTMSNCRTQSDRTNVMAHIPIQGNFQSFMFYQPMSAMAPIGRQDITSAEFYLTLPDRTSYGSENVFNYETQESSVVTVPYLPLNGEGFQVCVRFHLDDGVVTS